MNLASFGISYRTVRKASSLSPSPRAAALIWCLSVHEDLLQVLSILTMERPVSFAAEDVRDEKVRRCRHHAALHPTLHPR